MTCVGLLRTRPMTMSKVKVTIRSQRYFFVIYALSVPYLHKLLYFMIFGRNVQYKSMSHTRFQLKCFKHKLNIWSAK